MNEQNLDGNEDEQSHDNEIFDYNVDLSETQLTMSQFNNLHKRKRNASEISDEVYKITNQRTTHSRKFNCSEQIFDIELNCSISKSFNLT